MACLSCPTMYCSCLSGWGWGYEWCDALRYVDQYSPLSCCTSFIYTNSFYFQANNSHLRDQWLYSIQWKVCTFLLQKIILFTHLVFQQKELKFLVYNRHLVRMKFWCQKLWSLQLSYLVFSNLLWTCTKIIQIMVPGSILGTHLMRHRPNFNIKMIKQWIIKFY